MSETKHTPGPWAVSIGPPRVAPKKTRIIPGDNRDFIIATAETGVYGPPKVGEDEANARLISAAPELLEALKAVILDVSVPKSDHPWAIQQRKAHEMAAAAIRKAEGNAE